MLKYADFTVFTLSFAHRRRVWYLNGNVTQRCIKQNQPTFCLFYRKTTKQNKQHLFCDATKTHTWCSTMGRTALNILKLLTWGGGGALGLFENPWFPFSCRFTYRLDSLIFPELDPSPFVFWKSFISSYSYK